jgi:hypothetical protein
VFDFDNNQNASVAYRMISSANYGWNKLYFGTLNDTCTFSTGTCLTTVKGVNLGAVNPDLFEATTQDSLVYRIYGTLISDCGSASKGCLEYNTSGNVNVNAYADAGVIDIEGSLFLRTGTFQSPSSGLAYYAPSPTFIQNRFVSDLAGVDTLDAPAAGPNTKTCLYRENYFSGGFGNISSFYETCGFLGNVGKITFGRDESNPISTFSDNIIIEPVIDQTLDAPIFSRNIWLKTAVGGNGSTHMLDGPIFLNWRATDNICLALGNETEGHCMLGIDGSPTVVRTMLNNISLPATGNGANSGQWMTYATTAGNGDLTMYFDHNGMYGTGEFNWGISVGHGGPEYPNNTVVQSYRANVHWASSAGIGDNFMIGNSDMGYANGLGNSVNTANLGWNATYNQTASTGFGPGVNSNCNVGGNGSAYLGSPYDICIPSRPSPDNTTYDLLNTDPKVIDNTRNPLTWASRMHGQAATEAGIGAVFAACQNEIWCVEEARTWTARGFQPTNLALKGKAHDGRIVGFTGTYGSGYTGNCTVTFTPQDAADLGTGAAATCSFVSGVPKIQIANPGANYRIATPATVTIGGTCGGGCTAASLTPVISPHDIGPVQMVLIPGAM